RLFFFKQKTAYEITDPQVFEAAYKTIINTLTSNGAKGVVATIPDITSIPHFTTVPYNPLTAEALGGEAVVTQLNTSLLGPVKQILTAIRSEEHTSELQSRENLV